MKFKQFLRNQYFFWQITKLGLSEPKFTDAEVMTIYLYAIHVEQRFKIKQTHEYANDYLRSWFPLLPSYEAFNKRLNHLNKAFKLLLTNTISAFVPSNCIKNGSLLDSLPIITCSDKCQGKVANEIPDKVFCSTNVIYYYGLKLHALAFNHPNHLPFLKQFQQTPASENDLISLNKHGVILKT